MNDERRNHGAWSGGSCSGSGDGLGRRFAAQGQNYQWVRTVSTYGTGGTSTFNIAPSVTVDPSGNVWATDQRNSNLVELTAAETGLRVSRCRTATACIQTRQGTSGPPVCPPASVVSMAPLRSSAAAVGSQQMSTGSGNYPADVATDPSGNVWVPFWESTNFNQAFAKYNSSGTLIGWYGSGITGGGSTSLFDPCGLAIDKAGNVWVSDGNNRIVEFNNSGTFLQQFGSSGSGNGQLSGPEALAFDAAGNLWVADDGNDRIEEFSTSGVYLGQVGSVGTGPGRFQWPEGLAFDAAGNMWVADTYNNRLQEFSPVPEPSTLILLGIGAVSMLAHVWRKRRRTA